jgi:hypothetical protein
MKYAAEMGSGAMMCIPSFIKTASAVQKLIGENTQTHSQHGDRISLRLFLQNKGSGLIKWIFEKQGGVVWTGFIWLWKRAGGGLL